MLGLSTLGAGPLPALGTTFNPGTGAWTAAADAELPHPETLHLGALDGKVTVVFERNGVAHVTATTDHDAFLAQGYLHARFRLFQMDLERRIGNGRLAEVFGAGAPLDSDRFELQLGLRRTADMEWAQLPEADPARAALLAYTEGINERIREDRSRHDLPVLFKLTGYEPADWRPQDSLVIQGYETQVLDFQTAPLDYALLVKSLGFDRTMQWLPVLPPNEQHPYAPGPYAAGAPAPLAASPPAALSSSAVDGIEDLRARLARLPHPVPAQAFASNNWAVDGAKSASGRPLMAGDPHLDLTLPSIWFQVSLDSPGLHASGVGIPGTPGIVIGHNQHVSWSLTDTQAQATLYYQERTDRAHPGQYFWNGGWREFQKLTYEVPVKGAATDHLVVDLSVHGPIITQQGLTLAVDWMGALPSQDLRALMGVARAASFQDFRQALTDWHAPTHNFVYADDSGHIALLAPGYYPQVRGGQPWLPMPGTGESDVTGIIPYDSIPAVVDPPTHFVFSANQRPVGDDYPYYIGTSYDDFANGYRADRIFDVLSQPGQVTYTDMQNLQNDRHEYLAKQVVPKLMDALAAAKLTDQQQAAAGLLRTWTYAMDANSQAASIWSAFWDAYLSETFKPWWTANKVPVDRDRFKEVLSEDLEVWTLRDPQNAAFTPPGSAPRTAQDVMISAFASALDALTRKLGPDPKSWQWGRQHSRRIGSLVGISSLDFGPVPTGGDQWTLNVAGGEPSTHGPSWRFVMDWGTGKAYGIYPGGQAENPASPWYRNRVDGWLKGRYEPMLDAASASRQAGSVRWELAP